MQTDIFLEMIIDDLTEAAAQINDAVVQLQQGNISDGMAVNDVADAYTTLATLKPLMEQGIAWFNSHKGS